jgi:6-phosphogluconolactonase (cycloisomerase 2 family)
MAVHPSGSFLYTANAPTTSDAGGITAYSISSAGTLAAIGPEVADAQQGGAALHITVDSAGAHAYVAGNIAIGAASYTIDPNSGSLAPLNPQPFDFQNHHGTEDLAIVNGTVYLTSAVGIDSQTINSDGSLSNTTIGVARTTVLMDRLVVSGGKFLYATTVIVPPPGNPFASPEPGHIYGWTVNGDGSLSPIASTPVALTGVAGIAASANLLFASSPAGVSVYAVDSNTGVLSQIPGSPFSGGAQPGDLAVDHSGKFLYTLNVNQIPGFAIGSGGALNPVPGSPFSTGGLQPSVLVSTP